MVENIRHKYANTHSNAAYLRQFGDKTRKIYAEKAINHYKNSNLEFQNEYIQIFEIISNFLNK